MKRKMMRRKQENASVSEDFKECQLCNLRDFII